jgi:riboflavin synthase
MFTGLVEKTGLCGAMQRLPAGGGRLVLAPQPLSASPGDSIAVNGCCLTVTSAKPDELAFDVLAETLRCTNLGDLVQEDRVNLELPLRADGRLGGHFVQGHVDAAVRVMTTSEEGADLRIEIELPPTLAPCVAHKGSVAVNGVSLTVAEVGTDRFTVWIIPHTRQITNLGDLRVGSRVNLETDILAKYVGRFVPLSGA